MSDAILEACPTKILLPNAELEGESPNSRAFYELVGLNQRELDILQTSIPKQHYYVVSPLGRRGNGICRCGKGRVVVRGRQWHARRLLMEQIRKRFGDGWRSEWLRFRGLGSWADYLHRLAEEFEGDSKCLHAKKHHNDRGFICDGGDSGARRLSVHAAVPIPVATEFTQLLNYGQLLSVNLTAATQLANEIQQLQNSIRNLARLPNQIFGTIQADINSLAGVVQGGFSLAYSMANPGYSQFTNPGSTSGSPGSRRTIITTTTRNGRKHRLIRRWAH